MEGITLVVAVIVVVCLGALTWNRKGRKLPPGPFPLPIVGNMLQLGSTNPHQSFAKLSKKYGPLISIRLGSSLTVVISSPEIAKQVLTGQAFADRPIVQAIHSHDHIDFCVAFLPVAGRKWKQMRRICMEQMFTNQSLETSQGLRHKKLEQLVDYVQKCCDAGRAVNIREAAFTTTLNLISATLFSSDATEFGSATTTQLKDVVMRVITIFGTPNLADFFPILKSLDPQGVRRDADLYFGRLLSLIKGQIDQRLQLRRANPNRRKLNDLLEKLVDVITGESTDYDLTHDDMTHLLFDLYLAGSDSTMMTIEWIMAELLLHPDKLSKAKDEVRNLMGDRKIIDDAEISKLPYLEAVVKEIFRYHPPAPFLFPHKASEDMEINGYFIPKDTQILVNTWAIGRDPSIWPNPESFEPERFLNKNINAKGQYFEFTPFGSGRRMCPGLPLAQRITHTAVAALIHNFDWEIAAGESERNGEMLCGPALHREAPLMAIPMKP